MLNNTSFSSDRNFHDNDHFPHGINRSGEFTRQQAELLIKHGWAYKALAEGSRAPVTVEEEQFVAVIQGKKAAETAHEKAWQLYCKKISQPKPNVSSPYLGYKSLSTSDYEASADDDFE